MNVTMIAGRLCTVPKIKLLELDKKTVRVCKIAVAVVNELFDSMDEAALTEENVDFFQCIAFGNTAKMISDNFVKGARIVLYGKMRNHRFEDANAAKHFTNVLLIEKTEFGDTEAMVCKISEKRKHMDLSIMSDLKELYDLYDKVCMNGFLCIDEDDYYSIATSNMVI